MQNSILNYDFSTLSRDQRVELLYRVWSSLQADIPAPLGDDLKELLDARFREMDEHPELTLSWDEFHERAFRSP